MTRNQPLYRLIQLALAALLGPAIPCLAEPPSNVAENRRETQSCVLLKNDNVLFGHAYQMGEYVVVRTLHGGEVQLSRKEVACWANSLSDLYQFRVDRRQKGDLGALIRDARWCLQYDLYDHAADALTSAREIDPSNRTVQVIDGQLQRLLESRASMAAAPPQSTVIVQPNPVQPAGYEDTAPALSTVSPQSLRGFASQVQPMLLSRCGRCHSENNLRGWALKVPAVGARASSKMTRANLAATLGYLNPDSPEESRLLMKATTAHGGQDAPLSPRNAKAIQSLRAWIAMTAQAMPRSDQGEQSADRSTSPTPEQEARESSQTTYVAEREPVPNDEPAVRQEIGGAPARLPQVQNPFDPDLFNRRFHR